MVAFGLSRRGTGVSGRGFAMTRFLRLPEVCARVGLSPMTIWRKEHANPPTFPRRVKLSAHAVGWPQDQIESWCLERLAERDRAVEADEHAHSLSATGE